MKDTCLLITFSSSEDLCSAVDQVMKLDVKLIETLTPFAIPQPESVFPSNAQRVFPRAGLFGGLGGAMLGFSMQWYANFIAAPENIGGRPLNSWPAFLPVTFSVMVLCSALALALTFFLRLRLPWLSHPVFAAELNLSQAEFGLLIQGSWQELQAAQASLGNQPLRVEVLP